MPRVYWLNTSKTPATLIARGGYPPDFISLAIHSPYPFICYYYFHQPPDEARFRTWSGLVVAADSVKAYPSN